MGLEEGGRKRTRAIWHLVGLPSYKNLTEATQLLLARYQAEILAVSQTENEPRLDEPMKQQISIQEWRPPEPASVKKARLARRAGKYARYQQVVEFGQQGMRSSPC